jgi:hypothetical protein
MTKNKMYTQTATMEQIIMQFVAEYPPDDKVLVRDAIITYVDNNFVTKEPTLNNAVYRFQQWFEKNWKPEISSSPMTMTMKMENDTTFGLYWFSASDDELVGEVDLPEVTPENVREWFFLSENTPLTDSFIVRASQRQHIARFVKEEIDLNKYDYFLECFSQRGKSALS